MIQRWSKVSSKPIGSYRVFSLRSDVKKSPRTGECHDFYILDSVDWVNVIAVTPRDELVMIEQYRHGSDTVELEIPGGMMDGEDGSPEITAVRELREETGYEGRSPQVIGKVFANPAILTNTCYTVLVRNCRLTHPVEFDQCEDLATHLVPVAKLPQLVAEGKIQHSLIVAALYYFDLWQRKHL